MAGASDIKAGRAYVEVFARDNVQAGLRSAQKRLTAFGAGIAKAGGMLVAAGGAILAPILAMANSFAAAGDKLDKMSGRTGMAVEALSEMGHVAEQSGASLETFEKASVDMGKNLVEAAAGSAGAARKFRDLGLSVRELAKLSPDQQFEAIAQRVSEIPNPALRASKAMALLGKSGRELLPMMAGGAEGIQALRKEARELGIVMSTEDATAAATLTDAMAILQKSMGAIKNIIGAAVAPVLTSVAEKLTWITTSVLRWVDGNRELVRTIFKVAAGVAIAGVVLVGLGMAIVGVGAVLGGLATMIGVVSIVLAAVLSPIGLVVAAIVGLGAYLLKTTAAGGIAMDWLGGMFGTLKDTATEALGGIGDALAAGDIQAAAKILWLALQMEWQRGINFLNKHWIAFKGFFLNVWSEAVAGASRLIIDGWAALQSAWVNTTSFLLDAWNMFTDGLLKGWRTASNFISKGVLRLMSLFDSSIDVEVASKDLDDQLAGKNSAAERARNQAISARERDKQERLAGIESDRQGARGEIDSMTTSAQSARESKFAQDLANSQAALDNATADFRSARQDAADKRPEDGPGGGALKDLMGALSGAGLSLEGASSKGTFSAFGAAGIGGNSAADRTARNTEQIAKEAKKTNREIAKVKPKFG